MSRVKEHPAEKEIRKAADDIQSGNYVPDPKDEVEQAAEGLGLALGLGTDGVGTGQKPVLEDFRETRDFNELSLHPRVQEALDKMRNEIDEHPDDQEAVEMAWMMHEMLERASFEQKWKGQERWEGKENMEMRYGRILSPQQFYAELCEVIGMSRVLMGRYAHLTDPDAKSGRVGLYIANPHWKGEAPIVEFAQIKAAELRKSAEKELVKAKRLRLAKHNAEADKTYQLAGDMIQAATEIYMEQAFTDAAEREKQFLRVGIVQWPYSTEWMMMNFSEFGVPTTAKFTGWRTALLTMFRQGVITAEEAEYAFPVGSGPAANWYLEQLYLRRNRKTRSQKPV